MADSNVYTMYLRPNSTLLRQTKHSIKKTANLTTVSLKEDRIVVFNDPLMSVVMTILCRNKTRLLLQAWKKWTVSTNVFHDYADDLRIILSRPLQTDELRYHVKIQYNSNIDYKSGFINITKLL